MIWQYVLEENNTNLKAKIMILEVEKTISSYRTHMPLLEKAVEDNK